MMMLKRDAMIAKAKKIGDPVHRKKSDLKNSDDLFIVIRFGS